MGKTERRISRGRARSGREPLEQSIPRGHASTGLSTARIARCAALVRTVVSALGARSAVVHQSASTVVSALHARSAVGVQYASTVVSALSARSVVGHQYANMVVCALCARSVVGDQSASTVVCALIARSARSSERIINQITTSQSVLVPSRSTLNRLSRYHPRLPRMTTSRPYPRLYHRSHRRPALSAPACSPRLD